jgi:hypothetical protein
VNRRIGVRFSYAIALAAVLFAGAAAAASAEAKNPLAGSWTGTTSPTPTWPGPAAPISFQITNSGRVVNLSTTVTLNVTMGKSTMPGDCQAAAPVPVGMPPVKMNKPSASYPKGKRFDYDGPNASLTGTELSADGKINSGFRKMEGALLVSDVEIAPGAFCRTGNVHYFVKRVGGK